MMLLLVLVLAVAGRESTARELETALQAQMEEAKAPGAAYAIVRDGRVVAARGLGVRAKGGTERVTADTLFMVGSVTKTLTATAVLRASEAGTLDMDAPIGRTIAGLDPVVAGLTLRQLLSQTSGLGDLAGLAGASDEGALLQFARSLGPRQFVAPAGSVFSYSNPGFALAGAALEAARREPYAEAMRRLLFAPLGMKRTTLRPADSRRYARAAGHDVRGEPLAGYDLDTRLAPAGYAYSSANDLARFVREWLGAYEGRARVLSRTAVHLMAGRVAEFPPTFDGSGYGHGLFVDDRRAAVVLHHAGTNTGFTAQVVLVPQRRLGLVVLVNRESVVLTKTIDAALQSLAGLAPVVTTALPEGEPLSEDEAGPLLGRYLNRWSLELFWSAGLRLRWGGVVREVRRLGSDRFVARGASGPSIELRSGRGADGTPFLRQFLWAFSRDFAPAPSTPSATP